MKADTMANRSNSGSKSSKLRCLNLSFEGKELMFKNGDLDNGRLPHGGYKGSKKHPLGMYSWDKGKEYQRQLRDELNHMLETDGPEANGSPQWALEAHRQPTHSGESPLLLNKFLSPSKHETTNASMRSRGNRSSKPMSANGVQYYRPNRMHQYLSATELKDSVADNEDALRYGRPTRTTLLRARQRVSPSANSYELRRQIEHRMDELRNTTTVNSPKEFALLESELDGESYHSFLTGARYNRAHYLDSKSLTQYGVYMPRNNPLGCFVIGQRGDFLDTTSAPPDSPRSDIEQGSSPLTQRRRPTTAPGYGYGRRPHVRVPPSPRQAWGDASCSLHITNGDNKRGETTELNGAPVIEEIRLWSPLLNVKGSKLPLKMAREGPLKVESRLPSVHGTSLSRRHKFQEVADDNSDANQPPPSPAGHVTPKDDSHFPAIKQELEIERKSEQEEQEVKAEEESKAADEETPNVPLEPEEIKQRKGEETEDTEKAAGEEAVVEEDNTEREEEADTEQEMGEAPGETSPEAPAAVAEEGAEAEEEGAENKQADDVLEGEEGVEGEAAGEAASTGAVEEQEAEQTEEDAKEEVREEEAAQEEQDVASPEYDDQDTTKADDQGDDVKFFLTEDTPGGGLPEAGTTDNADQGSTEVVDSTSRDEEADEAAAKAKGEEAGEEGGAAEDRRPPSSASSVRSKGRRTVTFSEPEGRETQQDEEAVDGDDDDGGHADDNETKGDTLNNVDEDNVNDTTGGAAAAGGGGGMVGGGPGGESEDTDAEEVQGQTEPLRVVVTHIEKNMGAPVAEETE